MSQWNRNLTFPPLYFGLLAALVYAWVLTGQWVLVCLFYLAFLRIWHQFGLKTSLSVFCLLAVLGIYLLWQQQRFDQKTRQLPQEISRVQIVPDTLQVNGENLSFQARAGRQTFQAFYRLQSKQEQAAFQRLAQAVELEVVAEVAVPEGQRNFNGFNYRNYLRSQGIAYLLQIQQIKAVHVQSVRNPVTLVQVWRRRALVFIDQNFPAPMKHYMTGLLFGKLDKEFDEMSDLYSSLGIIHLFALSGMQVGFFIYLFRWLLLRCGWTMETVDWLQYPFSFIYAGLTGFSISVVRALVQRLCGGFHLRSADGLAVTFVLCLVLFPLKMASVGAVLSFTYAFLIATMDFTALSAKWQKGMEILAIPIGAVPVLLVYFYQFQPISILLTLVFSVLFDFLLLPILTVIFALSPLIKFTWLNPIFIWLEAVIRLVARIFPRPFIFGKPSLLVLVLLFIALAVIHDFIGRKRVVLAALLLFCGGLWFAKQANQNELTVVDVGQGDAIFMRDQQNRTLLIDVGGRVDIGKKEEWQQGVRESNAERTLIPYLLSQGVSEIDTLVLTHADQDHVGDLLALSKAVAIKQILVTEGALTRPELVAKLRQINACVLLTREGQSVSIFDSHLQILAPHETGDGGNDDSIVLYGKLLGTRFLFTGDLEEVGEQALIQRYPDLQVDVLKAGHHGSKGSSSPAFLQAVQPKLALISAGKNNRYHHPNDETLTRFDQQDMRVYRTDQQGAIRLYGRKSWQIETVR